MPTASIPAGGVGTPIDCGPFGATIANVGPSTVSYRDEYPVDAGNNRDGTIASGSSAFLYGTQWAFVSSGSATLNITPAPSQTLGVLDSSVARDGYLAAWDGTLHKFVGREPGATFRIGDEGAVGDGTADDGNPFRNALAKAMAVQAAGGVGIVEGNPTKTYRLASVASGNAALLPGVALPSTAGVLIIRGNGATIKLASAVTILMGLNATAGDTVRNIIFDDWIIDHNTKNPGAAVGMVAHFSGQFINYDRLVFRNLKTLNGGSVSNAARPINVACSRTDSYGAGGQATNSVTRILVDNCDLGVSGGSGGSGVAIITFCNQTKNPADLVDQALPRAAAYIDDVTIRHSKYESGSRGVQAATTGFMVGGDGWAKKVLIDDCWAAGSGDDNYELAGVLDGTISRCVGIDGYQENVAFTNNHGGQLYGEEQVNRLKDFKGIQVTDGMCKGGNIQANYMNGGNGGRVILDGVELTWATDTFAGYGSTGTLSPTAMVNILGGMREVDIRDLKMTIKTNYVEPSAALTGLQTNGIDLRTRGGVCVLRGNAELEVLGSYDKNLGASSNNWTIFPLRIFDGNVNSDDFRIGVRSSVKTISGKVKISHFAVSAKAQSTESFTAAGRLAYSLKAIAGALSDLSQTGGVVQSAANHTTPKQLRLIEFSGSSDNVVSRMVDGSLFVGGLYERISGFKLGWRLRSSQDGTTGIDAYITDDGANSVLNIDEILAGVVTNKATVNLGARVADQTAFGIRARVQKETVTLDYYTSASAQTFASTGATTLTGTVTTSRLTGDGPAGFADIIWTPEDATAYIDNVSYDCMPVVGGRIVLDAINVREPLDTYATVSFLKADAQIRVQDRLRIRGNVRKGRNATTLTDLLTTGTSPLITAGATFEGGYTPLAVAAAKTGTTWTVGAYGGSGAGYYACPGPWPEDARGVLAAGATTPYMQVSRDGGATFAQVAFAASAAINERLQPGDVLRFTGAVPSSLNLVPVS